MAFLYLRTYQSSESIKRNKRNNRPSTKKSNEKSPSKSNLTFIIYFLNKRILNKINNKYKT